MKRASSPSRSIAPSRDVSSGWAIAILILAGLAVYLPTLSAPFLFDDLAAIVNNPSIRRLADVPAVFSPPNDGSAVMGRPLVNLSFAVNYAVGGTAPLGYHLGNLLLHLGTGLLLFRLVRRILLLPRLAPRFGPATPRLAFVAALLWLLHPLQTESVSCVAQRTELLVSAWYVLTLYSFLRSTEPGARWPWAALAVAASVSGMSSKEVMVTAPVVVFFLDGLLITGSFRAAWARRKAFYGALAASWLMLVLLLAETGGARGQAGGFGLGVGPTAYALKQADAIVTYLRLAVLPYPLVLDYGRALVAQAGDVLPQLALISVLLTAVVVALRRSPSLGFAGFFFFAVLAPSSSVVPLITQTVAEHRMYLPLAAVVTLAVLGAHRLLGARGAALAACVALGFGTLSAARNVVLRSELTVWADTAARMPQNPRAAASYALALSNAGRPAEALRFFQRALALDPASSATEQNLANTLVQLGRPAEAMPHYQRAIDLAPEAPGPRNNLAVALGRTGQSAAAIEQFEAALRLAPNDSATHKNYADLLFSLQRYAAAARHYQAVLALEPPSADFLYNTGLALAREGQLDAALPYFEQALQLKPDPIGYNNYGKFLAGAGRNAAALRQFQRALELAPGFAEARRNLEMARRGVAPR